MQSRHSRKLICKAALLAIRPDPYYSVTDWADERRILPPQGSSEAGRWRTSRTPYLAEVMASASPGSGVEQVVLQFGTQLGKTEGLFNVMGATIDLYPAPIMYVQPTVETVQRVSKQRIQPTFDATPSLAVKVAEPRTRTGRLANSIQQKDFPGGSLVMTGANSAPGLRSMPVKVLLLDEIDAYPDDVQGEGDPIELALRRTTNFPGRKIVMVSTPTIRGRSKIERARQAPDATNEHYQVPCPHCDTLQPLVWDRGPGAGGIRWEKKDTERGALIERVWYECAACQEEIDESYKTQMLEAGVWVPRNKDASGRVRSFHLSSLYSPAGWYRWADAARDFLRAVEAKRRGDLSLLKVFTNTVLAETWEEDSADSLEPGEIAGVGGDYDAREGELPPGAFILTMAVDIQGDRLEGEVIAWGRGEESWRVDYFRAVGDPGITTGAGSPWNAVEAALGKRWYSPEGVEIQISATCIDTGGHHTTAAYEWIRPRQARKVWATKGSSQAGRPLYTMSRGAKVGGVVLLMVGTEGAKDLIFGRLRVDEPGPGFTHFPAWYPEEYFDGLTAEKAIITKSQGQEVKRWVRKRPGLANEPVDLAVLNLVAIRTLGQVDWDSFERKHEAASEPEAEKKAPAKPRRKKAGYAKAWRSGRGRL
jgi:phage terminase large subunit GpA-like protein